jgi:hypothetical protein
VFRYSGRQLAPSLKLPDPGALRQPPADDLPLTGEGCGVPIARWEMARWREGPGVLLQIEACAVAEDVSAHQRRSYPRLPHAWLGLRGRRWCRSPCGSPGASRPDTRARGRGGRAASSRLPARRLSRPARPMPRRAVGRTAVAARSRRARGALARAVSTPGRYPSPLARGPGWYCQSALPRPS